MNIHQFFKKNGINCQSGLFLVYGKAATGKTTFLMEMAKLCQGKAFIVDSENGFSIERFEQISGKDSQLDNLMVTKPRDFEEQGEMIGRIVDNAQLFGFVGVDTIGRFYRSVIKEDARSGNNEIARQMRVLKEVSRDRPVVVCNQVYQDIRKNDVELLGGHFVKKWCDVLVKLDEIDGERIIEIIKPKEIKEKFILCDEGFKFS